MIVTAAPSIAALPQEGGRPRVQRLVEDLPTVHLEAAVPRRATWSLEVDGLVEQPLRLSMSDLTALSTPEREIDLHCVWGWSRPGCRWGGVDGDDFLERCRPRPEATCALFGAADSPYASCVRLDDVVDGMLAWSLDGRELPSQHGGPLRFVGPAHLWGYKGVKWLARVTFLEHFEPGFWEAKVGDAEGRIPDAILDLFERP